MTTFAKAEQTKRTNIIDMALTFSAMIRIFAAGSKPKIMERLEKTFSEFDCVKTQDDFENLHLDFCTWFEDTIRTAEKPLKLCAFASYGHAAKVFDIAAKVYVYYSMLPSPEISLRLRPYLHGAIDTQILRDLKSRYPNEEIFASNIESIGKLEYERLQRLIARHISDDFDRNLLPVQYDDIQWQALNR